MQLIVFVVMVLFSTMAFAVTKFSARLAADVYLGGQPMYGKVPFPAKRYFINQYKITDIKFISGDSKKIDLNKYNDFLITSDLKFLSSDESEISMEMILGKTLVALEKKTYKADKFKITAKFDITKTDQLILNGLYDGKLFMVTNKPADRYINIMSAEYGQIYVFVKNDLPITIELHD